MDRDQKAQFVEEMKSDLAKAPIVILTDFKGSTVAQMDAVRRACEPVGVRFRVIKNTLCRRAIAGTAMESLGELMTGNIGVIYGGEDPVAAAKVFRELAKGNDKFAVRGGFFDGDVIKGDKILAVADLPSKEQLLSTLLATIQEGPRQVLGVIQGPARDLLYVLNNYASKLEEG